MPEQIQNANRGTLLARAAGILVILAGVLLAAGLCAASPQEHPVSSIFDPRSTPADSINRLAYFVLTICGIIFVVVFALLVYATFKFRERPAGAGREPAQVY